MAKMLAAELRQEAAKLAHQNTLLKQSAAATRNLQNQIQQVSRTHRSQRHDTQVIVARAGKVYR